MPLFGRKEKSTEPVSVPEHIAIILDGNGRWAKKRGMPRTAGHAIGAETFRRVATYCRDIGVKYLTAYAFSTENWRRSQEEIAEIWRLLRQYLQETFDRMERDRVKVRILGDRTGMPEDVQELLRKIDEKSTRIEGITLCLCINYGSRDEITHAAQSLAADAAAGRIKPEEITEEMFSARLYSEGIPDPDLLIRPGGEVRLSNFLLWQLAYSEMYFTDTLWPDFSSEDIDRAVKAYSRRDRRYGGVKA